LLYAELHGLAQSFMRGQRTGHTLQPTALVHEAWLRLFGKTTPAHEDRAHLMRTAARAMRQVLIDYERRRRTDKRGGDLPRITFSADLAAGPAAALDVLALDESLERLGRGDPELVKLVELRYFPGLSIEETAVNLGVSTPTVERNWRLARSVLRTELDPDGRKRGFC
jgi:RNA polymerase sigma factor (TIGR02999 family)